ncbi:hypothetical protein J7M28_04960, partial [bacterium]|nr:hypothetical protein [bacterium]
PQLLEEMTELMERVTRTPGDAAKMEVAGLLLCAKNLDLRAYKRMLTLLDKRLTRHSDSNPYRARMHSVFHQAAAQIRRRIGHIHHINGIMKQIEGALSSLPARPPGGRHRSIITLGKHISSLPQSERTHSAAAKAIEALLALLESSKTPWADRISAMSALSVIGERRALPALQELAAKATSSRTTLVKQAIRAIIRKNIHSPSSQEQEPTTAAEMKPKNVDSTRQAGPYSIHQNQRRALGKQPILAVFPQIQ